MNKKAMIMLYFCVFGFIAAAFLFFRYADDYKPTGDLYLGEKQIEVFQTYQEADADIYYIQHAALLSSQKASKENFKSEFESELNSYLKYLKLTSNDFDITYYISNDKTIITGISKKQLSYTEIDYTYKIYPAFKVEVPYALVDSSSEIFV
ncbi:hypothetical protein J4477_00530 [Candidatus Pacearchaeota archaeon]|nr:hypothetical protein [Candidatus Pacearchaeota archaeon]